jgi:hypothetical protein
VRTDPHNLQCVALPRALTLLVFPHCLGIIAAVLLDLESEKINGWNEAKSRAPIIPIHYCLHRESLPYIGASNPTRTPQIEDAGHSCAYYPHIPRCYNYEYLFNPLNREMINIARRYNHKA